MEMTTIPGLDKEISRVGLGTWAIGGWMWGGTDEEESVRTIRTALDKGFTLVDTAPVYGFGRSEEIVGKAIADHGGRDRIAISTKAGIEWDEDEATVRNSTPERLQKEIEDSLRRLRTDYIDVYHVHWPDPLVPFEETAATLEKMREQGKIVAAAVSNYDPEQMDAFRKATQLSVCQPPYNVFEREIEDDVLPYCKENGIALLVYGAICRGMLSGKMSEERELKKGDLRNIDPKFQKPRFGQYLEGVDRLDRLAQERYGKRVIHLAVRWILDREVDVALWGARRPDQLEPVDSMFGWRLSQEDMADIDRILDETIDDPVGPEFMAPPARK